MTKKQALKYLKEIAEYSTTVDCEVAHISADDILLKLINDPDITDAYNEVAKLYR